MPGVSCTGQRSGAVVIPQCVGASPGPTDREMPGPSSALNHRASGYELVGRVGDFPSGTDVLWYRKRLTPPKSPPSRERSRSEKPSKNTAALMTGPDPEAGTP